MIATILASSSSFNGVSYNTNKIDSGKGEFVLAKNFGPLQGLDDLRPEDYKNYLKMVSNKSKRTQNAQFHAAISCKGKEYGKQELADIAEKWLLELGYGSQPYLIVFHKDTENNHVHVVTTRVDQFTGKRINSSFEKLRAREAINRIMAQDYSKDDLRKYFSYNFSNLSQYKLLLESAGFKVREKGDFLQIIKDGVVKSEQDMKEIMDKANGSVSDKIRLAQLKGIYNKYRTVYDSSLQLLSTSEKTLYQSELTKFLRKKFGLEFFFHAKDGKQPYGYTIVDHAKGNVFKGGELDKLANFITPSVIYNNDWAKQVLKNMSSLKELDDFLESKKFGRSDKNIFNNKGEQIYTLSGKDFEIFKEKEFRDVTYTVGNVTDKVLLQSKHPDMLKSKIMIDPNQDYRYYTDLISAAYNNFPTFEEGLSSLNLKMVSLDEDILFFDVGNNNFVNLNSLTDEGLQQELLNDHTVDLEESMLRNDAVDFHFNVSISDDVDDEAIHGRNRKRKRKSRINTR